LLSENLFDVYFADRMIVGKKPQKFAIRRFRTLTFREIKAQLF